MYDIITYNGDEYIAQNWNGEYYGKCYKRAEYCSQPHHTFPAEGWENKDIALKPIYKEIAEDEFELIGYEEI
jgi:hypothetical protein